MFDEISFVAIRFSIVITKIFLRLPRDDTKRRKRQNVLPVCLSPLHNNKQQPLSGMKFLGRACRAKEVGRIE